MRLGTFVVLTVMVLAFNTRSLGAPDSESVSLAPALSVPMSAPAGSIAPTIGTANTAVLPDGRFATPAGRSIVTDAYSNNLIVSRAGGRVYTSSEAVSNDPQLPNNTRVYSVIDAATLSRRRVRDDDMQYGLAESPDGTRLYVSEAGKDSIGIFDTSTFTRLGAISLGARDFPWGLAVHPQGRYAYSTAYRTNTLDVIDTQSRAMVARIATGEYPFGVVLSSDGSRAYVSNWGLYNADAHSAAARQAGVSLPPTTPLGYNGNQQSSVWTYDLSNPASPTVVSKTNIGRQVDGFNVLSGSLPSGIALSPDNLTLAVTASNDDQLVLLDALSGAVRKTVDMHVFGPNGPTGAMPNAVAWAPDGSRLFVAEGGINAVAVVDPLGGAILGHIPTGWYPAAVAVSGDGQHLYVSSDKGLGEGPNGFDHPDGTNLSSNKRLVQGLFQDVPLACLDLRGLTRMVARDNGLVRSPSIRGGGVVPAAFGQGPSDKIKHVVFILKENRSFDQVLGDLPGAERDQRLNDLGGKITPNHHAIAQQFATGDNLYHVVLDSTDGHWVSGTGQENEFDLKVDPSEINGVFHGGDQIDGTAPENEPIGGMVWHHYTRNNISYKVWGEGLYLAGGSTTLPGLSTPQPDVSDPRSAVPGILNNPTGLDPIYPTQVPFGPTHDSDETRADDYLKELSLMNSGNLLMPQFSFLLLPNDHTNGFDSSSLAPGSFMAVNDHALGRIVDGLSSSKFWQDTAVFVVEDDTQGGRDSVDANRVLSLTAGAYVRPQYISHVHHSIYSILKTIDLILGVPPESVQEAAATSMSDYFADSPVNRGPYHAVPYEVDPTVTNSALAATGNASFSQAAELQTAVPSGAVDFGPITGKIENLVYQGVAATNAAYSPPLSNIQEHTLRHAAPPPVRQSEYTCSEGTEGSFLSLASSLPDTATRNPLLTAALFGAALVAAGAATTIRHAIPSPRHRPDSWDILD